MPITRHKKTKQLKNIVWDWKQIVAAAGFREMTQQVHMEINN